MRIVKDTTDNRFVNIKEIYDHDKHLKGYQFAERLGVDSIAFVCYDRNRDIFLLNNEYKPPIDDFLVGAFGGSLDKDTPKINIVKAEVQEEAGFRVDDSDITELGKIFVSTQMNQFCYLYLVSVDIANQEDREPENPVEAMAETVWVNASEVFKLEDWKSIAILLKAVQKGMLSINLEK